MSVDQGIRILLVEDASVMRKMAKKTLNALGFENIVEAVDGQDAVQKLQKGETVNLIISDWNMPNMSGLELLEWIRDHDSFMELPFLMATGRGEKKEVEKASDAGVSSFISKPFNADELKEKIEVAMGLVREEDQSEGQRWEPRFAASGKILLNLAHIQITDHLVLGVLKHLISIGKFRPKHFELKTHCMPSWNPVAKALERGTVDGACVLAPIAMDLFGYGAPIKLVLFAHKNGSIFVRNKKGGIYQEPYQAFFRTKSFYIPHFQSIHHMLGHMFFEGIGLQPGLQGTEGVDLSFEVVPPIQMPQFLADNPNSCGYLVAEPLGTKAIAAGIAELQFFSSELWENHPCCVVTMRDEFIEGYEDAVYEFTELLVEAGKFITLKPGLAAEIGVGFLDPDRTLGLRVPLLKNVLTEPLGITTDDLYPVKEDLDRIQHYMHDRMDIGKLIDIDEFVDLRFADKACKGRVAGMRHSVMHGEADRALEILKKRTVEDEEQSTKTLLDIEGKYLIFDLANQQFGIDILKIREIIKMVPVRAIPESPAYVKGIMNFRDKVVPVIDLRNVLNFEDAGHDKDSRIIVVELVTYKGIVQMGVIVDSVIEVKDINTSDIEEAPSMGVEFHSEYILGLAKLEDNVIILLDIDRMLTKKETEMVGEMAMT